MTIRFPIGISVILALVSALLLIAVAAQSPAGASSARASCGDTKTPKNDNGLQLKRKIDVKSDGVDCHTAKKTLKKFVKVFDSDEHTNVNGFDCRIPQKPNGSVFYKCSKGNKLVRGFPKG